MGMFLVGGLDIVPAGVSASWDTAIFVFCLIFLRFLSQSNGARASEVGWAAAHFFFSGARGMEGQRHDERGRVLFIFRSRLRE
jgi:hypothetical protein